MKFSPKKLLKNIKKFFFYIYQKKFVLTLPKDADVLILDSLSSKDMMNYKKTKYINITKEVFEKFEPDSLNIEIDYSNLHHSIKLSIVRIDKNYISIDEEIYHTSITKLYFSKYKIMKLYSSIVINCHNF